MSKPDNIPESQTEHYALLCEIKELRAELEKLKRQWAEDDRDITALEDENNKLLDGLAVERKKREDAERVLADWLDCWDTPDEWMRCRNNAKITLDRDADPKNYSPSPLEAQVEVLREFMDRLAKSHSALSQAEYERNPAVNDGSPCFAIEHEYINLIAKLPARAAAVRKVLEAAVEFEHDWTSVQGGDWRTRMQILVEAVREWRKE